MVIRAARQRVGPADDGQEMSLDDFVHCIGEEGYRFELVHGRLAVLPSPEQPHDSLLMMVYRPLFQYAMQHEEVINYVTPNARVFLPDQADATSLEPDIAAYCDFPHHLPLDQRDWRSINPTLVVEVVSETTADKDVVRNVELYLEIPSIREYWIVDPRPDPNSPRLVIYRRRGKRWQKPIEVEFGDAYETKLLPEFTLVIDPRRRT
jgi:Uma2 family endonuclease